VLIQAFLILAALAVFGVFIRNSHSVRSQAFKRIGFVAFLCLNLDAVLRPDDTTWLAHKLGVGRGTDLLVYLLVVAFAFVAVNTYLRFRTLERRFTDLARAVALSDAQAPVGEAALPATHVSQGRPEPAAVPEPAVVPSARSAS
jgi:hypothetical protein